MAPLRAKPAIMLLTSCGAFGEVGVSGQLITWGRALSPLATDSGSFRGCYPLAQLRSILAQEDSSKTLGGLCKDSQSHLLGRGVVTKKPAS